MKYYQEVLGFQINSCGEVYRDELFFLIVQADNKKEVRPSKVNWHFYAYTLDADGIDQLYEEFQVKKALIESKPKKTTKTWKEFIVQQSELMMQGKPFTC
jgi:hypothetical protein